MADECERPLFGEDCLQCGSRIQLFAADLDGTLLTSQSKVAEETILAFQRLKEMGIHRAFATGRPQKGTIRCIGEAVLEQLTLPGAAPGVYLNGCVVIGPKGEVLHKESLSRQQTHLIVSSAERHGWMTRLCGYTLDGLFCLEANQYTYYTHDVFSEEAPLVVSKKIFLELDFCKLGINGSSDEVSSFRKVLDEELQCSGLRSVRAVPCSLELCPVHASKARGLEILFKHLNVNKDQVVAIGDSDNDLEMLRYVRYSVCVANGSTEAKRAAKFHTISNDENAVAFVANCVSDSQAKRKENGDLLVDGLYNNGARSTEPQSKLTQPHLLLHGKTGPASSAEPLNIAE